MTSVADTALESTDALTVLKPPVSGIFLVSHLAVLGLATILDAYGDETVRVGHDSASLTFEPYLATALPRSEVRAFFEAAIADIEAVLEHDREAKSRGERKPTIRARDTYGGDPDRAREAVLVRHRLVRGLLEQDGPGARLATALCEGLGSSVTWLPQERGAKFDPSVGATAFDGAVINKSTDLVRKVFRELRVKALAADLWESGRSEHGAESPWAPPNSPSDVTAEFLAGIGLAALPVAQRSRGVSLTPAIVRADVSRRPDAAVFPILGRPVTLARLRALLMSSDLAVIARELSFALNGQNRGREDLAARKRLRALGVRELVLFPVRNLSTKQMVKFHFETGIRVDIG